MLRCVIILFERLSRKRWITIVVVGPFENCNDAMSFHELWAKQTRGITRRIQRGLNLYASYRNKYNLKMWVTQVSKETVLKAWRDQQCDENSRFGIKKKERMLVGDIHKIQTNRKKKRK